MRFLNSVTTTMATFFGLICIGAAIWTSQTNTIASQNFWIGSAICAALLGLCIKSNFAHNKKMRKLEAAATEAEALEV